MKRNVLLIVASALLLATYQPIHAETDIDASDHVIEAVQTLNANPNSSKQQSRKKQERKEANQEKRVERQEKKEGQLKELRSQREERLEKRKEQLKTRKQELQEKREAAREKAKAKREEFKEKLQQIRDERKQRIVERIANKLDAIQERWVTRLTNHVDRLEAILEKIKTRTQLAKENGHDVGAVETAISQSEAGISTARTAISNLAGQSYMIEIDNESNLGQSVSSTRQALQGNLQTAHQSVKAVRDSMGSALQALRNVPQVDALTE